MTDSMTKSEEITVITSQWWKGANGFLWSLHVCTSAFPAPDSHCSKYATAHKHYNRGTWWNLMGVQTTVVLLCWSMVVSGKPATIAAWWLKLRMIWLLKTSVCGMWIIDQLLGARTMFLFSCAVRTITTSPGLSQMCWLKYIKLSCKRFSSKILNRALIKDNSLSSPRFMFCT